MSRIAEGALAPPSTSPTYHAPPDRCNPVKTLNFKCSKEEAALIRQIVERAVVLMPHLDRVDVAMDLAIVHLNGCPLDLEQLRTSDDLAFVGDLMGIRRHLDPVTGEIAAWFTPRCAIARSVSHRAENDEDGQLRFIVLSPAFPTSSINQRHARRTVEML